MTTTDAFNSGRLAAEAIGRGDTKSYKEIVHAFNKRISDDPKAQQLMRVRNWAYKETRNSA